MKYFAIPLFLCALAVAGCSKKPITGAEKDALVAAADPIIESILQGYNNGDYEEYSKDFDEQMKNALTEKIFSQTREQILAKIGTYESRKVAGTYRKNQYEIVEYTGAFKDEKDVKITLSLQKYADRYLVSGLWFNSPRLRK